MSKRNEYDNIKERKRRGSQLQSIRRSLGYNQAEMAKILGVSVNHISNIEVGKSCATMAKMDDWCRRLGAVVLIVRVPEVDSVDIIKNKKSYEEKME